MYSDFEFYSYGDPFSGIFLVLWLIGLFSSGAVGIAVYIFRSHAVCTIARRRALSNPWLAWIPVASDFILGSISDQYQYLTHGKTQSRRKLLLALSIVKGILSLALMIFIGIIAVTAFTSLDANLSHAAMARQLMVPSLIAMALWMAVNLTWIFWAIFYYICKFDLYRSCDSKNAVAYFVLSILFSILDPIFLMILRNKEEGMPPRKPVDEVPPSYAQPQQEEPWEE